MPDNRIRYFTIPNIITLLNLFSGSLAIFIAFENPDNLIISAYLIGLSTIFDFFDGFTARLLKQYSEIGKQLDSLADLVSFGVAPSAILFQMMQKAIKVNQVNPDMELIDGLLLASVALIILFSALRLAKFNVDTTQTTGFKGLATPASAIFIASLPIIKEFDPDKLFLLKEVLDIDLPFNVILGLLGFQIFILESYKFFLPVIVIISLLMISDLPMFSLKFKNYSWRYNRRRYIFLIISIILILTIQTLAIPAIIILYIFASLLLWIMGKAKQANLPFEIEAHNLEARKNGMNGSSENTIIILEKELKTEFKLFE